MFDVRMPDSLKMPLFVFDNAGLFFMCHIPRDVCYGRHHGNRLRLPCSCDRYFGYQGYKEYQNLRVFRNNLDQLIEQSIQKVTGNLYSPNILYEIQNPIPGIPDPRMFPLNLNHGSLKFVTLKTKKRYLHARLDTVLN